MLMTTNLGMGKTGNMKDKTTRYKLLIGLGFCLIAASTLILRARLYGDPRLAIGTLDTQSYIDSSRPPLLSRESFIERRLFTTNILYKIVSTNSACPKVAV